MAVWQSSAPHCRCAGMDRLLQRNVLAMSGRVAKARGISEERVRKLVKESTSSRDLGLFGQPRVNVMTLNFTLDALNGK